MSDKTKIPTDPELEQEAFEAFAKLHPHEAYATWPERFWAYFQTQLPGISRERMEDILNQTAKIQEWPA